MKRILLSAVAALAITTGFAKADNIQVRLETETWKVWSDTLGKGDHLACFAKHFEPTSTGFATFGFSQNDMMNFGSLHYTEDGITWKQSGTLTIQIDNLSPWTASAEAYGDRSGLIISLGPNPARFLREVAYGSVMRITTLNGTRVFSLAGSNQAIMSELRCIDQIVAQRNGGDTQTSQLPAPRYTPLPTSRVIPRGPATEL